MNNTLKQLKDIDEAISLNIEHLRKENSGLLTTNVLKYLRDLTEVVAVIIKSNKIDSDYDYNNIQSSLKFIKANYKYNFISKFHKFLEISASHYTSDFDKSQRLMLKYYDYILRIRKIINDDYNVKILSNFELININQDPSLEKYYKEISNKINNVSSSVLISASKNRYYILKIKPFYIENNIYYEVTFTSASDYSSKFNRTVAFTKLPILSNYSVKLDITEENIKIQNKNLPINIITDWSVSIRPCELERYSKILGFSYKAASSNNEYLSIMKYISNSGITLNEVLDFDDEEFNEFISRIHTESTKIKFIDVIIESRKYVKNNLAGRNIITYLLFSLNNKIMKNQISLTGCERLNNLKLDYKCIPFDQMPLSASLCNHNPRLNDIIECFGIKNREHEFLSRIIRINTENEMKLYTQKEDLESFSDLDKLINMFNGNLYYKHKNRELKQYKNNVYIHGYEEDTLNIINNLRKLSNVESTNYSNVVEYWLNESAYSIDCDEKREIIKKLFDKSKVAIIYGAAGTGKSTLINHISNFYASSKKLYLAVTNPAVDNLRRRVKVANADFKTMSKFNHPVNHEVSCDILFIDECSTVSNSDMRRILEKAKFEFLVLVGDVYQIESINYGNWFEIARNLIPNNSIFELFYPRRSSDANLIKLWDLVRKNEDNILEHIQRCNYSKPLESILSDEFNNDEIILCLNYDGLYGINNLNKFMQLSNQNSPVQWDVLTYKIGDPILFTENERFSPLIYNNLKGSIVKIEKNDDEIIFDIRIEIPLMTIQAKMYDFKLISSDENSSIIRFSVLSYSNSDEDEDSFSRTQVPFQIAYAVSIHKAQGLEFESVKLVVTEEVDEMITHNIFYTAITRAKSNLSIYWSPVVEKNILNNLKHKVNHRDVSIFVEKHGLKIN